MGNKEQEKVMLEHIMFQAHNLNNHYLFAISTLNYVQMDHSKIVRKDGEVQKVGMKLGNLFKTLKLVVEGPLWNDILQVAQKKMF